MLTRFGWAVLVATVALVQGACGDNEPNENDAATVAQADAGGLDQRAGGKDSATDSAGEGDVDGGGEADGAGESAPSPALCDPVTGAREAVVIQVTFGDGLPVCATDALSATWFTGESGVAAFYAQASGGRLSVEGRVVGPVSIPPIEGCIGTDPAQNQQLLRSLHPQVDSAAADDGIAIAPDATRVYVLPASIRCGAKGPTATAVPPLNRIFLYGDTCENTRIAAHEMGHVLGVNHASALDAASGKLRDYGDESDVMGGGLFPPNGPHRAQLGWIPADRVAAVAASGTFRLSPLGNDEGAAPQLLVINRHDDPSQAVYVSYRQAAGLDATLPTAFVERTSVHEFAATCPPPDARPLPKTVFLGTVGDQETYRVEKASITIQQLSHDDSGAVVEILLPNG